MARGAKVVQADDIAIPMDILRASASGGADLVMADVGLDIAGLIPGMPAERISVPVGACGHGEGRHAAVKASKGGAQD